MLKRTHSDDPCRKKRGETWNEAIGLTQELRARGQRISRAGLAREARKVN